MLLLGSCNMVHEWPGEPGEDPTDIKVTLKIKCQTDFAGNYVVTKAPIDPSQEVPSKYDRRYVVEIRNGEYDDNIVKTFNITRAADDVSDLLITTDLKSRKYNVVVWMDYILKGTNQDLYYKCDNGTKLSAIHLPGKAQYIAGTDYKDGQHYLSLLDLTKYAGQWYAEVTVDVPLQRPMAKISVLSTDIQKYAESLGYTGDLSELAKTMKVEISYNGYLPTGFNALTGRLNDAEVGFGYEYRPMYPSLFETNKYTLIGSDYVFVNGESSSVTITVVIKDGQGQVINEVGSIVVPIFKNKETIVTDKFFTKDYFPGFGIDPSFDGEFNVYV